jgi:hypothetical protein
MNGRKSRHGACLLALALGISSCESVSKRAPTGPSEPIPSGATGISEPAAPAVFVGAGDIADCGLPGAEATARLLDDIAGTVFTTGDNAYFHGSQQDYERCYEPTWGRHKRRTRPVPGNHEYETPGAAGYFWYFGDAAAPGSQGFYSFDLGAWHIIALNSNIPMDHASEQVAWLRADFATNRTRCTLAYEHHPLFSSGVNGPIPAVRAIWDVLYEEGADVVLSGHAPQDPVGRADAARGLRQFVVGTGGGKNTLIVALQPNSEVRFSTWGVLKLTLRPTSYDWEFVPVAGESWRDSGAAQCH